jgi:hypothetical protein
VVAPGTVTGFTSSIAPGEVNCPASGFIDVTFTWTTVNAYSVMFALDPPEPNDAFSGPYTNNPTSPMTVPINCADGDGTRAVITTKDATGQIVDNKVIAFNG